MALMSSIISEFGSAASGKEGVVENLVSNNPRLSAIVGAIALHYTEGHGFLRGIADYWTLSDLFQGKAGALEKGYLALNAGEGAADLAGKAGLGTLGKVFAGFAAGVAAFMGEGKMEADIKKPKPAIAPVPGVA